MDEYEHHGQWRRNRVFRLGDSTRLAEWGRWPGPRCWCTETGVELVTGDSEPRTCPVCGADASKDGVDTCTDAHGDEDGGHGGSSDGQDRDAQDADRQQATLSGFNGDDD